ncbi:MAG: permease [Actinomycetota bacterium]|nr:permease [Actinomycetota bacterium]
MLNYFIKKSIIFVDIKRLLAFVFLIYSVVKNRDKTKKALKIALKTLVKILPVMIIIVISIGFMLGFLPSGIISRVVGEQAGFFGVLVTAALGSILFIPSLISFPIAASLLDGGASIISVSAFITTLTMVGVITIPIEVREMGKKITVLRNIFSFIFAVIIALIMEIIL